MSAREWLFQWDDAPLHSAKAIKKLVAHKFSQMIGNTLLFTEPDPNELLLIPKDQKPACRQIHHLGQLNRPWEGVVRTPKKDNFTKGFQRW
jgi:hypothetical protein